jgi:hypothetical protein
MRDHIDSMARIDPATLDGLHPRRRTSWRTIWGDIVAVATIVAGAFVVLDTFDAAMRRHHHWLVWIAAPCLAIVVAGGLVRVVGPLTWEKGR